MNIHKHSFAVLTLACGLVSCSSDYGLEWYVADWLLSQTVDGINQYQDSLYSPTRDILDKRWEQSRPWKSQSLKNMNHLLDARLKDVQEAKQAFQKALATPGGIDLNKRETIAETWYSNKKVADCDFLDAIAIAHGHRDENPEQAQQLHEKARLLRRETSEMSTLMKKACARPSEGKQTSAAR